MKDCNMDYEDPNRQAINEESSRIIGSNGQEKRTSRMAIASVIFLGLAGICFLVDQGLALLFFVLTSEFKNLGVFSVLAVVFLLAAFVVGIIACIEITMIKQLKGYKYTIAPICLGAIVILTSGLMVIHAKYRARRDRSTYPTYRLQQLGKAIVQYSKDNNGYLPVANKWCDLLMEYNPNLSKISFKHPLIKNYDCNFAFNKNLSALRLDDVPDDVVLLFEADGNWNLNGGPELLATRRREHGYIEVLFSNQIIHNYWFDKKAVVILNKNLSFIEKPLRWEP